jgi:hypothetical protein
MSDFFIPNVGQPCRHLDYGRGTVVTADAEYTTIEFAYGMKKFLTPLMTISFKAEVPLSEAPKTAPKKLKVPKAERTKAPRILNPLRGAPKNLRKDSHSGYPGVSYNSTSKRWYASINFQGKAQTLLCTSNRQAAIRASNRARLERAQVISLCLSNPSG